MIDAEDPSARLTALATAALGLWDLGRADLRLINLSENATFAVTTATARYALRLHRPGYHSRGAIGSELAWAQALRRDGVAITPRPRPGRDGALIQTTGDRHLVLFDWEDGAEPGIDDDLAGPFETLGALAAGMHAHARAWPRPPGFARFTWDVETTLGARPHWGRWRDGVGVDAALAALFGQTVAAIGRRLAAFGQGPARFGLIHGDLRLANLLIDGPAVKVIDFDDCGHGWFMYDAATPVSFYEHDAKVPELIAAWVRGYRRIAPLAETEVAEIPTFVMLRRLLLVAWIGSHPDAPFARSLGAAFTHQTAPLCEGYLRGDW